MTIILIDVSLMKLKAMEHAMKPRDGILNSLPRDLLTHICDFLDHTSILSLSMTCKNINDPSEFDYQFRDLWTRLVKKHIPFVNSLVKPETLSFKKGFVHICLLKSMERLYNDPNFLKNFANYIHKITSKKIESNPDKLQFAEIIYYIGQSNDKLNSEHSNEQVNQAKINEFLKAIPDKNINLDRMFSQFNKKELELILNNEHTDNNGENYKFISQVIKYDRISLLANITYSGLFLNYPSCYLFQQNFYDTIYIKDFFKNFLIDEDENSKLTCKLIEITNDYMLFSTLLKLCDNEKKLDNFLKSFSLMKIKPEHKNSFQKVLDQQFSEQKTKPDNYLGMHAKYNQELCKPSSDNRPIIQTVRRKDFINSVTIAINGYRKKFFNSIIKIKEYWEELDKDDILEIIKLALRKININFAQQIISSCGAKITAADIVNITQEINMPWIQDTLTSRTNAKEYQSL